MGFALSQRKSHGALKLSKLHGSMAWSHYDGAKLVKIIRSTKKGGLFN